MTKSPEIIGSGWGKMRVEGLPAGKDFKLWPGGGRSWDWGEHGTGHGNGIQVGDVEELIANGCQIVILTSGRFKRLKIPPQTIAFLEQRGIDVRVTETEKGIELYNELARRGEPVGGLFHSTC